MEEIKELLEKLQNDQTEKNLLELLKALKVDKNVLANPQWLSFVTRSNIYKVLLNFSLDDIIIEFYPKNKTKTDNNWIVINDQKNCLKIAVWNGVISSEEYSSTDVIGSESLETAEIYPLSYNGNINHVGVKEGHNYVDSLSEINGAYKVNEFDENGIQVGRRDVLLKARNIFNPFYPLDDLSKRFAYLSQQIGVVKARSGLSGKVYKDIALLPCQYVTQECNYTRSSEELDKVNCYQKRIDQNNSSSFDMIKSGVASAMNTELPMYELRFGPIMDEERFNIIRESGHFEYSDSSFESQISRIEEGTASPITKIATINAIEKVYRIANRQLKKRK